MTKGLKKTIAFTFFLLAGITLGAFLGRLFAQTPYLSWLSWGQTFGISADSPVIIDLSVITLAFGLTLKVTIAQIITIPISILIYAKTCKNI